MKLHSLHLKPQALLTLLLCGAVLYAAPFIGASTVLNSTGNELSPEAHTTIFWSIRLPRVLLGFLAGAGLSVSGMVYQAIFKNALATPYTLGVASGASLGAVFAIHFGLSGALLGVSILSWSGLVGALGVTLLVYCVARSTTRPDSSTLLLSGVAIGLFCSSLILFLQCLSSMARAFKVIRWLMGGLEIIGYGAIIQVAPVVILGALCIFLLHREIDLLSTSDEIAQSRGVAVVQIRWLLFFLVSIIVGTIVAFTGPIGFIGMMVPHACRRVIGPNHLMCAPIIFLAGGTFLVFCDTIARVVAAPVEIPVGVITALLGGPFFLYLLLKHRSAARSDLFDG